MMKIIEIKSDIYEFPAELEIELSVIDSGIIITEMDDTVNIILKDKDSMISSLSELSDVSFKFTYIDRPEFPAVNSELRLKTSKGLSVKYDYFFNCESEYEMNLLLKLLNQRMIYLFLFSDILVNNIGIEIEDEDRLHLSGIIEQVNS